jgi:hypothetical protein
VRAAGGIDEFLARYAILVVSDHGQSQVREVARLGDRFRHATETLVLASNRTGHVVRTGTGAPSPRELAERLDGEPSADVVLFQEDGTVVARRGGEELRVDMDSRARLDGDLAILDQPDAVARAAAALACPNAGEVVVSAAEGWEFEDLGGGHHRGGGSHGSLLAEDSLVPVLGVGIGGALPERIVDLAPAVLAHFGVAAPTYAVPSAA